MSRIWNESSKAGTRAFDAWKLVNHDLSAFLNVGLRFVRKGYEDTWEEVGSRPATEDDSDWPDAFEEEVQLLWPHEFEWMFLSAVVKDAVTAFEVYLEAVTDEVLSFHGLAFKRKDPSRSLPWDKLRQFCGTYFAIRLDDTRVKEIRGLRHLLTHRRGELRTDDERKKFGEREDGWPALEVVLTEDGVKQILADLAAVVRLIDSVAYRHSWGGERIHSLKFDPVDSGES